MAVPLFYFISGFLFFYKTNWNNETYFRKLKGRLRSLLVPYLFWNAAVILFFLASQLFLPHLTSGANKPVLSYTFPDLLWSFWDMDKVVPESGNAPMAMQFWFIRNLMVTVCFSPLLIWAIRKFGCAFIATLGLMWLFDFWPKIPGFGAESFFFFSLGATYSINQIDFMRISRNATVLLICLYIACVCQTFMYKENDLFMIMNRITILVGIYTLFGVCIHFINNRIKSLLSSLSQYAFFLYALHMLPLLLICRIWSSVCIPVDNFGAFSEFFGATIIITVAAILIYKILKFCLPGFTSLITGGRNA